MTPHERIVSKLKEWLGEEGKTVFGGFLEKHGEVSPVFMEGAILHPVHFREGMQVRNFLRTIPECEGWTSCELDDRWGDLVKEAIAE